MKYSEIIILLLNIILLIHFYNIFTIIIYNWYCNNILILPQCYLELLKDFYTAILFTTKKILSFITIEFIREQSHFIAI